MSKAVSTTKTEEKVNLFEPTASGKKRVSLTDRELVASFDEHAVAIAKRQYFMPEDKDLLGMFRRVANWVASPEHGEHKRVYAEAFYDLMTSKRFCPGGRVLAGAGTQHGNVLNCFVQDGSPQQPGSNEWVTHLATKLALVTKVGGGNGLCLDPLSPKRAYTQGAGQLYVTISPSHADYEKVKTGTYMDLVHGKYVTKGYRHATFIEQSDVPAALPKLTVGDSVDKIWQGGSDMIMRLLDKQDVLLDLSGLRPEGTPVNGSGGNSSGPSSFAVEVFDNFAYWASLGGAEYAGPVATLRYIFAPTLRVIRQGGTRRGAGMATMSITHSDINDFITSKDLEREQTEGDISTFNISVLVTDKFMQEAKGKKSAALMTIADHAWQTGEPGLIYIDRINEHNPMRASLGDIKSTNPCGEIPLYAGEPCDLGAINLAAYVQTPNIGMKGFDVEGFRSDVRS
jgi:ribonucleoside-diphosphate reductase alpha chain